MVSHSFDGEYIARTIEKLGFVAVRGSSSRAGATALLGLKSQLEQGNLVAFTIDGPRGPKYIAKPGPVLLSRASALPMTAFYVALSDAWVLNTWDALMIPKPFSKALVRFSAKIQVPADAGAAPGDADGDVKNDAKRHAQMAEFQRQLQAALERVTRFAEEHVAEVGSPEFPIRDLAQRATGSHATDRRSRFNPLLARCVVNTAGQRGSDAIIRARRMATLKSQRLFRQYYSSFGENDTGNGKRLPAAARALF